MIIISLDTASKKTGYAIYKNGTIITHGAWKIDQLRPFSDLERKINTTIAKYGATVIVAEDIYKSQDTRLQSAFDALSKCHGILHLISEKTQIPLTLIDPRRAKRKMWGYTTARADHRTMTRQEQKQRMCKAVERLGYQLKTDRNGNKDNDQADAIGILITYLTAHNLPVTHPKPNKSN